VKVSGSPSGSEAAASGVTSVPSVVVRSGPAETWGGELAGPAMASTTSNSNSAVTTSGGSAAPRGPIARPSRRSSRPDHAPSAAGACGSPWSSTCARTRCAPGERFVASSEAPWPIFPSREDHHVIRPDRLPSSGSRALASSLSGWPLTSVAPLPPDEAVATDSTGARLRPAGITRSASRSRLSAGLDSRSCLRASASATT
jgi:hypothetical protein